MQTYELFRDLAIIVIFAKAFGLAARKLKVPQVVGEIIAGLLIGPSILGLVKQSDLLSELAEIGVILLMFSAGLGTDLDNIKKTGVKSFFIACAGVFIPLLGGTLLYSCFYGFAEIGSTKFYSAVFIGVIMTATSVSITVETLKELGKLNNEIGTTILNAAIIDDVIGILVLTFVIGFQKPDSKPFTIVLKTILFFIFAIGVGVIIYKVFKWVDKRYPKTRRIPIAGLALCLGLAYIAERYFGIADITGAYVAGVILCKVRDSEYIAEKMDISSYMLFGPIFFASIGIKTSLQEVNLNIIWFSLGFILVATTAKIIGCGLMAKICGYRFKDSLKIGVGMMARGEVALIVAQRGMSEGLVQPAYFTSVILLILVTSIITPILLKLLYSKDKQTA